MDDYGARGGRLDLGRVDDSDLERLVGGNAQPAVSATGRSARLRRRWRRAAGFINIERGDVTFRFVNSWNYTVGNYTQTVTFTLSSP